MKKALLVIVFGLIALSSIYSRSLNDTLLIQKKGWLLYYLGHVIWLESNLNKNDADISFFTNGKHYENGLVVDYNDNARVFKSIAKCYSIKSLTNIDTTTGKGGYAYSENICIVPVKVKLKLLPTDQSLDRSELKFKRNNNKVSIVYWFLTNYNIWEIELLREKDKKEFKKKIPRSS